LLCSIKNKVRTIKRWAFFQETVRIRDQGQESEELATALSNLARVLRDQKRYSEAEPLYKRALAIREKAFGPNHESVAAVLAQLCYFA
jgi:tetratricopeptide (TPR) repeat protein